MSPRRTGDGIDVVVVDICARVGGENDCVRTCNDDEKKKEKGQERNGILPRNMRESNVKKIRNLIAVSILR